MVTVSEADGLAPPALMARIYRVWSVFGVRAVKVYEVVSAPLPEMFVHELLSVEYW